MAVESIDSQIFSKETDYWSFGITVWEMFTLFDQEYSKARAFPYNDVSVKNVSNSEYNIADIILLDDFGGGGWGLGGMLGAVISTNTFIYSIVLLETIFY